MIPRHRFTAYLIVPVVVVACATEAFLFAQTKSSPHRSRVQQSPLGIREGRPVNLYKLTNAHGVEIHAMNYGGIIMSIRVPDRHGRFADVVLGHDTMEGYIPNPPYLGAIVGRYANRIANGTFTLDGKTYSLPRNDGPNTLHGGVTRTFDKVVWDAEPLKDEMGVAFTYLSKDGEEGFPGNLKVKVTYRLNNDNEFIIDYEATTDQATPINVSQHSYFNLKGEGNGDILDHEIMINADKFTPVDKDLIPTGELRPVEGTPFAFTTPTRIGARIDDHDEQLVLGHGYDHNFVINRSGPGMVLAARVTEPASGRVMEVSTTQPGVQFYTGNFLDGTVTGKRGHVYKRRYGFCLETQHFPDSPNHPNFPNTILRPGETFHETTIFKFSAK